MAHKINDSCLACGACKSECPVEAIHEGDVKFSIDPEVCTDCGTCVDVCPAGAISPDKQSTKQIDDMTDMRL